MDKGERDWRRYRRAWRIGRIGTAFNAALAVFCAAYSTYRMAVGEVGYATFLLVMTGAAVACVLWDPPIVKWPKETEQR